MSFAPEPILYVETDNVQFDGERVDVRGAQMGVFSYLSDGHQYLTGMIDGTYVPVSQPRRGSPRSPGRGNVWRGRGSACGGMVLLLAPGCQVTVHFGRVCIVNFLRRSITAVASGRSHAVAPEGRRLPGRLGCQPRPSLPVVGVGLGYGGRPPVNHYGALMRMSRPRCVEPPHSNRPGESEDLPGGNPARGWVRHSVSPTPAPTQPDSPGAVRQWRSRPWRSELAMGSASLGSPMCRSRRTNGLPTMAQDVPAVRHS